MQTWHTPLTPLSFLARSAAVYPQSPALVYGEHSWTFAQLHAAVEERARALRAAGVGPGDRVAYMMPNLPEMLIAQFAVPLLDAVLVSINTRLAPEEVRYICDHSGASVLVQFHPDAKAAGRKTEYSLIAVWKNGVLINMDSQAPNQAAWEWLRTSPQLADLRREVTFGNSRFDLAFTRGGNPGFMEVKGVTLEENGTARFPDAPTLRGVRHIRELTRMAGEGMDTAVLFVIQMKGVSSFEPNMATQPEFGLALRDAADAGVQILARDCLVSLDEAAGTLSLAIDAPVPVKLP